MEARLQLIGTCSLMMLIITAFVFTVASRLPVSGRMCLAAIAMASVGTPFVKHAFRGLGGVATGSLYMVFAGLLALTIFTVLAIRNEE
jgi:hypothetical protein